MPIFLHHHMAKFLKSVFNCQLYFPERGRGRHWGWRGEVKPVLKGNKALIYACSVPKCPPESGLVQVKGRIWELTQGLHMSGKEPSTWITTSESKVCFSSGLPSEVESRFQCRNPNKKSEHPRQGLNSKHQAQMSAFWWELVAFSQLLPTSPNFSQNPINSIALASLLLLRIYQTSNDSLILPFSLPPPKKMQVCGGRTGDAFASWIYSKCLELYPTKNTTNICLIDKVLY